LVEETLRGVVRRVRVAGVDGQSRGWGAQFDTMVIDPSDPDLARVASYLAKYSVKTTDGSPDFAYRFKTRNEIVESKADGHRQRLALTAWDLAHEGALRPLNLRLHAHALGFTGQLITKSRGFTTSFTALRAARASYMSGSNTHVALPGTFHYTGRGYDHPKAAQLAGVFHEMQRALRRERAEAKKETPRKRRLVAHVREGCLAHVRSCHRTCAHVGKKFSLSGLGFRDSSSRERSPERFREPRDSSSGAMTYTPTPMAPFTHDLEATSVGSAGRRLMGVITLVRARHPGSHPT
jgi:hypothetical protein